MKRTVLSVLALAVSISLAICSCSSSHPQEVPLDQAKLTDTVLAIRTSSSTDTRPSPDSNGQVVLINDRGGAKVLEIGRMGAGDILWGDNTLHFSGAQKEYALTKEKLTSVDRGITVGGQSLLLPTSSNNGYISIYFADVDKRLVTTGDTSSIKSWDITGTFKTIHQCGDKVVGITDVRNTRPMAAEDSAEQSAPVGETSPAEQVHSQGHTDTLVQLYPQPAADQGPLGSFTSTRYLRQLGHPAPCINNIAYAVALTSEGDGESQQDKWILRAWNTQTGEHHMHELHGPDGKPVADLQRESDTLVKSSVINGKYIWVTEVGGVYATNLNNGETVRLFATPPTEVPEMAHEPYPEMFRFHKNHLLVLNIPSDKKSDVTLTSYDVNTGVPNLFLTISASSFNTMNPRFKEQSHITHFAVNPDWLDKKISSTQ